MGAIVTTAPMLAEDAFDVTIAFEAQVEFDGAGTGVPNPQVTFNGLPLASQKWDGGEGRAAGFDFRTARVGGGVKWTLTDPSSQDSWGHTQLIWNTFLWVPATDPLDPWFAAGGHWETVAINPIEVTVSATGFHAHVVRVRRWQEAGEWAMSLRWWVDGSLEFSRDSTEALFWSEQGSADHGAPAVGWYYETFIPPFAWAPAGAPPAVRPPMRPVWDLRVDFAGGAPPTTGLADPTDTGLLVVERDGTPAQGGISIRHAVAIANGVIRFADTLTDGVEEGYRGARSASGLGYIPWCDIGEQNGIQERANHGLHLQGWTAAALEAYWDGDVYPYPGLVWIGRADNAMQEVAHSGARRPVRIGRTVNGRSWRGYLRGLDTSHLIGYWPHWNPTGPEAGAFPITPRDDWRWFEPTQTALGLARLARDGRASGGAADLQAAESAERGDASLPFSDLVLQDSTAAPEAADNDWDYDGGSADAFDSRGDGDADAALTWPAGDASDRPNHAEPPVGQPLGGPVYLGSQGRDGTQHAVTFSGPQYGRTWPILRIEDSDEFALDWDVVPTADDAIVALDEVNGRPLLLALQDQWASSDEADFDVAIVGLAVNLRGDDGREAEPYNFAILAEPGDTPAGWAIADAAIDHSGAVWVAMWRLRERSGGLGQWDDLALVVYRAEGVGELAAVIGEVTVARPPFLSAQLLFDRCNGLVILACQDVAEGGPAVIAWTCDAAGDLDGPHRFTCGSAAWSPPYGAWMLERPIEEPWRLLAIQIDGAGEWRTHWLRSQRFNPYDTVWATHKAEAETWRPDGEHADSDNWPSETYTYATYGITQAHAPTPVQIDDLVIRACSRYALTGEGTWREVRPASELF